MSHNIAKGMLTCRTCAKMAQHTETGGTFSRVSLIGTSPLRNVASLEEECPIVKLVASYVAVQSPQSG